VNASEAYRGLVSRQLQIQVTLPGCTADNQVLNDSIYRDNARYFQKVIAETNGLSKVANLLERAFGFGNGRPLLAQ
jgi:hypothetical protein